METIYDVLAWVVTNLRHVAADTDIDKVLAVIEQLAGADAPAASKGKS